MSNCTGTFFKLKDMTYRSKADRIEAIYKKAFARIRSFYVKECKKYFVKGLYLDVDYVTDPKDLNTSIFTVNIYNTKMKVIATETFSLANSTKSFENVAAVSVKAIFARVKTSQPKLIKWLVSYQENWGTRFQKTYLKIIDLPSTLSAGECREQAEKIENEYVNNMYEITGRVI